METEQYSSFMELGGIPYYPPHISDKIQEKSNPRPPRGPRQHPPMKEPPIIAPEIPPIEEPETPTSNRPGRPGKFVHFI